jgi:hypothetical protein
MKSFGKFEFLVGKIVHILKLEFRDVTYLNSDFHQLPIPMSLYNDMSSRNTSSHFTHTLSHYVLEHVSLSYSRMERVSILPL